MLGLSGSLPQSGGYDRQHVYYILIAHIHTVSVMYSLYEFVKLYIVYIFGKKNLSIPYLKEFRFLEWTTVCGNKFQSFIIL